MRGLVRAGRRAAIHSEMREIVSARIGLARFVALLCKAKSSRRGEASLTTSQTKANNATATHRTQRYWSTGLWECEVTKAWDAVFAAGQSGNRS